MGDTYHFGMPGSIIHINRILTGLWLVYIGYKLITNQKITKYNFIPLSLIGYSYILLFYSNIWKKYR